MILVAGATSQIGRSVVERLLAAKLEVRVLVRRAEDANYFRELGCEVVEGDVRDPEAVRRACEGAEAVLSLIGRHFARTEQGFWDVDYEGNVKLIDAAKQADVRRFVLLSALWSDRDPGPVIFRVKRKTEDHLIASGLDYAILRRVGKKVRLIRLPRWLLGVLRPFARLLGFGTYEAILFYEMLADHGFYVAPGTAATREILGRDPASIDAIIDSYYSDHARTAWRDSFYGTLLLRAS